MLAAASRSHARAVADGDTSLGSSPFRSTGSKTSLYTKHVNSVNYIMISLKKICFIVIDFIGQTSFTKMLTIKKVKV